MNEDEQQDYLLHYDKAKEEGVPFFPNIIFKDALVSLLVFIILVALAYFLGAPLEQRANPADTTYTPRPEWYFLFLFQLLKYFPGKLEVIGVIIIPTLIIACLFLLPLFDRSPERQIFKRLPVGGIVTFAMAGIITLTVVAVREAPPPAADQGGDPTARLYLENCASCHGASISVPPGANLHNIISQGKHDGMPAWSGDLTSDQIDALAGFILSPGGSQLFTANCGTCHKVDELVAGNPLDLRNSLEEGKSFPAHADVNMPDFMGTLSTEDRSSLLNFLVAPDGRRLFVSNCSACHGSTMTFSGSAEDLRKVISQGGLHLDMPAWKEQLQADQIDQLAKYVVDPAKNPESQQLFKDRCSVCHGEKVPQAASVGDARQIIESGGAHLDMPVWGDVLTSEQIDALVSYTLQSSSYQLVDKGQTLFAQYCSACHGGFGEGGPNPTQKGDIIAPISSAEFLKTRDDFTLQAIISQGQPNFGMSPFSITNGGSLEDADIQAIVSFIRSWEAAPPVELPKEIRVEVIQASPDELYSDICAQCHGSKGEGGVGPSFQSSDFQSDRNDQQIFDTINQGHASTAMIGWGDVLSADQITQLVSVIRGFASLAPDETLVPAVLSFSQDVQPLLDKKCKMCHGSQGGWDESSYSSVTTSGDHAPVILPGDPDSSLLVQKLLNQQTEGMQMPPGSSLSQAEINLITSWILSGAPDN